jgi:hypothetical protein
MRSPLLMVGFLAYSVCGLAAVSFEEKVDRVNALNELSSNNFLALDAYKRELQYEKLSLDRTERIEKESQLISNALNLQIHASYEKALKETGDSNVAYKTVAEAINSDLESADASLKEELKAYALETLNSAFTNRGYSTGANLSNVESYVAKGVDERMEYLNSEECCARPIQPTVNPSKDAERKKFNNLDELVESITSTRDSARWISKANHETKTAHMTKNETKISIQIKFRFLGADFELGPFIKFKREITTTAVISAEGMHPALNDQGGFDYFQRDKEGRILKKNGVEQKRFLTFVCLAQKDFSTEYGGSGGFSLSTGPVGLGGGAEHEFTKSYQNSVTVTSRRIAVPETVGGKYFNVKILTELCHKHFLGSKIQNNLTVEQSLDNSMRNLVKGLVFSHSKTQCATDEQCYDWYNNKVAGLFKNKNWPRCRQMNESEQFFGCTLRGQVGQNCGVVEKVTRTEDGKKKTAWERTSDGQFEFECDTGLTCKKYQNVIFSKSVEKYFRGDKKQYAKAKCVPVNPKTYKSPLQLQYEREAEDDRNIPISFQ